MKSLLSRLSITILILLLGKSFFDLNIFASFFNTYHSTNDLVLIFWNTAISGFIMVLIFNYLQRAFRFIIAITYTYILLFALIALNYYDNIYTGYFKYLFELVGCNISINLLLILTVRGLIMRMGTNNSKGIEKNVNISFNIGILLGGTVIVYLIHLYPEFLTNPLNIYLVSAVILSISYFAMLILLIKDKNANTIVDSLQEIKAKQNIFKLLFKKYFTSILIIAALSAFVMVFTYAMYVKINVIKYNTTPQLTNIFAISALIYAVLSIAYELFFKEKAYYSFGIKVHLLVLPIVIIVFATMLLINTFYLKFVSGNEFFFFVPIVAGLFLVFAHFAFVNIFYPVINSLYLPLKSKNQNDFYIKSSFFGYVIGIGLASYAIKELIPKFNYINDSGYVIINGATVVLLIIISRILVYKNYKGALHDRLTAEESTDITQKSFVNNIIDKIKKYSGAKIVRIINLLYIINPVKSKKFLGNLTTSDDTFTQRAGLISAIKLYLLEIHNEMQEISKTKYYSSSPNRDKIEQLLIRFDELKTKMKKPYYIPQLSISKKDIERVYGGLLAIYAPEDQQPDMLSRLVKDPKLPVAKNAIISSAGLKDVNTIKAVIDRLGIAELSNAAYSALLEMDDKLIDILEDAFYQTGQSEKVQIKIVRLLGDIANETAVEYLLKKLNYTNQNIISAALEALSKCNIQLPEKKTMIIKHELEEVCRYIVWNTSLLIDLEKSLVSEILLEAMRIELKYNYKSLFNLLALFYNPGSIELIRKNLWSENYEKVNFALELASVIIKDEMKPMILPLIRPMSNEERLKKMQLIFTTEKMSLEDILYDIIQRDYKWINPWTKACAITEIANINTSENLPILLANMVNPDPMLAELSSLNVFSIDKDNYFTNKEIFGKKLTEIVSNTAIEAIEKSDKKNNNGMPILKFEIIKYLKEVKELSNIPGEILKNLTDSVTPLEYAAGEVIESIDNLDIFNYHYIIYAGKVDLSINNVLVESFGKGTLLSTLDLLIDYDSLIKLTANTDVQLYKIDPSEFADNLSFYDEIPYSILENTSNEDMKVYEKVIKNEREYMYTRGVLVE